MEVKLETTNKIDLLLDRFEYLKQNYIEIILNMIDFSTSKNILPMKIYFMVKYIKDYIKNNEIEMIESGINYLLPNKDDILNFNINNLDELEDNLSIKEIKKNINAQVTSGLSYEQSFQKSNEIIKLIIEIKENSKKLNIIEIQTIKKYIELLISILEKIKILYE
jgi:hypothetical protein